MSAIAKILKNISLLQIPHRDAAKKCKKTPEPKDFY